MNLPVSSAARQISLSVVRKVTIGYIECKDIDSKLDIVRNKRSIHPIQRVFAKPYLDRLPRISLVSLRRNGNRPLASGISTLTEKIVFDKDGVKTVGRLFESFFMAEPLRIGDSQELVKIMAAKARLLKDTIMTILDSKRFCR